MLVITPAAVASSWVNTETNLAIELQHEGVLHLIPLMLEATQVPLVWRAYQRVPFRGGYEAGFEQLLARLDESPGSPRPLAGSSHPGTQPIAAPRPPTSRPASRTTSANDLVARLAGREPGTRAEAALALGRLGQVDTLITTALLRLYNEDRVDEPRHAALEALLALGRAADVGMVFIPAGEFLMGSDDRDREADKDEKPQHRLYLPAYYIDRTPVTNAHFRRFIEAGGYANAAYWPEAIAAKRWEEGKYVDPGDFGGKKRDQPALWDDKQWNGAEQPVVDVSWYEALAYARWAGKRLPTEAEWEKAARGTDGRLYPWGNEWDPKRLNSKESRSEKTTPAGRYSPDGDSPYKVADMAGNVWEWCSTRWWDDKQKEYGYPYNPDDGREELSGGDDIARVLRGGSWYSDKKWARCAARNGVNPRNWNWLNTGGFRC